MKKSYHITSGILLAWYNQQADIHNCYTLQEITVDAEHKRLAVRFAITDFGKQNHSNPPLVILNFAGVTYSYISPTLLAQNGQTLDEIGFKESDDTDINWLIQDEKSSPDHDMVLRFINDDFVRVRAEDSFVSNSPN
jgi:hypothetical protein